MKDALIYSIPVLLGYFTIGTGFGLLVSDAGYPWFLALLMSVWMYAGAGQYIAVGLFVTGTTIWEACLIQLVVNARHIAYGLSMINRYPKGALKPYLIFSLTDETFALLSSLPPEEAKGIPPPGKDRDRFMFYVSILDQCYWIVGTIVGAVIGYLIPFDLEGIGFALTALFIVLFLEQIFRVFNTFSFNKLGIFLVSALAAIVSLLFFPERIALLAGMILAIILTLFFEIFPEKNGGKS
jgi:4-azaleucine resistance transporter AzlC